MVESNKVICKVCKQLMTRIEDGFYPDGRNKRYLNEEDKIWSGRKCPNCLVKESKERMRNLRFQRKLEK